MNKNKIRIDTIVIQKTLFECKKYQDFFFFCSQVIFQSLKFSPFYWILLRLIFLIGINQQDHLQIKKNKILAIQSFIKNLPEGLKSSYAKTITLNTFHIKQSSFYYYYNKIQNKYSNYNQLILELDRRHYQIFTEPFQLNPVTLPQLLILISPKMKENFQIFGLNFVACMDTTFNIIKQVHSTEQKYKVGFIVGISSCSRIVPFCLFITVNQTKERYLSIIKTFLNAMKSQPSIFITDEAISIKGAIKQLIEDDIYHGHHGYDIFHILRNLKKQLSDKRKLTNFSRLAKCENFKEFQYTLNHLIQQLNEQDSNILQHFVKQAQHFAISQMGNIFTGFSISDSIVQKTHDLIKQIIPIQKSFTFAVNKIVQYLELMGQKVNKFKIQSVKYEEIFENSKLKQIRYCLDHRIFKRFINQYKKAIYCSLEEISDTRIIIKQIKTNLQFFIHRELDNWICQCLYKQHTGILCSHLMRLCIDKHLPLKQFIHKRWILSQVFQQTSIIKKRKRRGRITRRNRH